MQWDEDIDFLAGRKSAPKQGRRSSNTLTEDNDVDKNPKLEDECGPQPPMRTRKMGVWSDEGTKSAKNRGVNLIEQERFQNNAGTENDDDDIPVIPDIEDIQDDSLNLPDVKPVVTVDKSTYKELDNQLDTFKSEPLNFGNLDDIDLSFLTSKLYPEKAVQPCTEIWTMESLYSSLSASTTG